MFFVLEENAFAANRQLMDRMFKLRQEVFLEQLEWNVTVTERGEVDEYDAENPAYLIWCSDDRTVLYGSLRLMPTTGPTLLYDVFRKTFPSNATLSAPGIWEGTRLCIDEQAIATDLVDIDARRGFCMMLLALCETALSHGIHTMISNYEPPTRRLYKMAGAPLEELGRSDGFGRRPVCAGSFEVSADVLQSMRNRLGIDHALMSPKSAARAKITASKVVSKSRSGVACAA